MSQIMTKTKKEMATSKEKQPIKPTFVFPFPTNPNIGRRTGVDVKAGKNIRRDSHGFENFDDYFTETEDESSMLMQSISSADSVKRKNKDVVSQHRSQGEDFGFRQSATAKESSKLTDQTEFVLPFPPNPNIGRRTGIDVKAGKNIRKDSHGFENFDDYFTETEDESSVFLHSINSGGRAKTSQEVVFQPRSQGESDVFTQSIPAETSSKVHPINGRNAESSSSLFSAVPCVGRRTGRDVRAGKNIRVMDCGYENFDDYFSDTETESTFFISDEGRVHHENGDKVSHTQKRSVSPIKSMSPFSSSQTSGVLSAVSVTSEVPTINTAGEINGTITKSDSTKSMEEQSSAVKSFQTKKRLTYSTGEGPGGPNSRKSNSLSDTSPANISHMNTQDTKFLGKESSLKQDSGTEKQMTRRRDPGRVDKSLQEINRKVTPPVKSPGKQVKVVHKRDIAEEQTHGTVAEQEGKTLRGKGTGMQKRLTDNAGPQVELLGSQNTADTSPEKEHKGRQTRASRRAAQRAASTNKADTDQRIENMEHPQSLQPRKSRNRKESKDKENCEVDRDGREKTQKDDAIGVLPGRNTRGKKAIVMGEENPHPSVPGNEVMENQENMDEKASMDTSSIPVRKTRSKKATSELVCNPDIDPLPKVTDESLQPKRPTRPRKKKAINDEKQIDKEEHTNEQTAAAQSLLPVRRTRSQKEAPVLRMDNQRHSGDAQTESLQPKRTNKRKRREDQYQQEHSGHSQSETEAASREASENPLDSVKSTNSGHKVTAQDNEEEETSSTELNDKLLRRQSTGIKANKSKSLADEDFGLKYADVDFNPGLNESAIYDSDEKVEKGTEVQTSITKTSHAEQLQLPETLNVSDRKPTETVQDIDVKDGKHTADIKSKRPKTPRNEAESQNMHEITDQQLGSQAVNTDGTEFVDHGQSLNTSSNSLGQKDVEIQQKGEEIKSKKTKVRQQKRVKEIESQDQREVMEIQQGNKEMSHDGLEVNGKQAYDTDIDDVSSEQGNEKLSAQNTKVSKVWNAGGEMTEAQKLNEVHNLNLGKSCDKSMSLSPQTETEQNESASNVPEGRIQEVRDGAVEVAQPVSQTDEDDFGNTFVSLKSQRKWSVLPEDVVLEDSEEEFELCGPTSSEYKTKSVKANKRKTAKTEKVGSNSANKIQRQETTSGKKKTPERRNGKVSSTCKIASVSTKLNFSEASDVEAEKSVPVVSEVTDENLVPDTDTGEGCDEQKTVEPRKKSEAADADQQYSPVTRKTTKTSSRQRRVSLENSHKFDTDKSLDVILTDDNRGLARLDSVQHVDSDSEIDIKSKQMTPSTQEKHLTVSDINTEKDKSPEQKHQTKRKSEKKGKARTYSNPLSEVEGSKSESSEHELANKASPPTGRIKPKQVTCVSLIKTPVTTHTPLTVTKRRANRSKISGKWAGSLEFEDVEMQPPIGEDYDDAFSDINLKLTGVGAGLGDLPVFTTPTTRRKRLSESMSPASSAPVDEYVGQEADTETDQSPQAAKRTKRCYTPKQRKARSMVGHSEGDMDAGTESTPEGKGSSPLSPTPGQKKKVGSLQKSTERKNLSDNENTSVLKTRRKSVTIVSPETYSPTPNGSRPLRSILRRSGSLPRYSVSSPLHIFEMTTTETPKIPHYEPKKQVKIIQPEKADDGLRRSRRTRVKTLEWYKNERILYKVRKSGGFVIDGIISPEVEEDKKPGRKRRQGLKGKMRKLLPPGTPRNLSMHTDIPSDCELTDSEAIVVVNPVTGEEVEVDCVKTKDQMVYHGPSGEEAKEDDPMLLCKALVQTSFAVGDILLRPMQEKPTQFVRNNTMVFRILYGKLAVTIHRTTSILESGDVFFIPQGNTYSLKNLRNEEAKLCFFQLKG